MADSFVSGADGSKDTPEPGERWLIPVDMDNQRTARVEVVETGEDTAEIEFQEDTSVGPGDVLSKEYHEGETDRFDLEAFEYGKPLDQ